MSGFKLIAIRPHNDCDIKFTKVLEKGKLYQFYSEYKFYNKFGKDFINNQDSIDSYSIEQLVPDGLYKIGDLEINISAIVGKNGTGKSTIIELFLYSIYVLGTTSKLKNNEPILKPFHEDLLEKNISNDKKIALFLKKRDELEDCVEKINSNKNTDKQVADFKEKLDEILDYEFKLNDLQKNKKVWDTNIKESKKEHNFILKNLKCSIYFEINDLVYEFNTADKLVINIKQFAAKKEDKNVGSKNIDNYDVLDFFFYSVMLNYSHHALNSEHLGYWINTLFHKNDGYKTPAVINPMRTDGNIDINVENELAKSRLLINLLIEALHNKDSSKKINITENQYVYKVRFKYNVDDKKYNNIELGDYGSKEEKENFIIKGDINDVNLVMELLPLYFDTFTQINVQNKNLPYSRIIINYLISKIKKILLNYPEYTINEFNSNLTIYFRKVLPKLKGDNSHITFKISRAMFFLKKSLDKKSNLLWNEEKEFIDFDLYELLEWMEIKSVAELYLIFERIPPSIFEFDFILDEKKDKIVYNKDKENKLPRLYHLSSGEQHKIHTINSIVYHLNNIFSVHKSNKEVHRIKYNYVNIIFDEIELYFHPDFQREFINDLLNNIKRLKYINEDSEKRIKGLNFLFSTHSPFILSDIPKQNTLLLKGKNDDNGVDFSTDGTFGTNIHDSLIDNFFMKSTIGEYSRMKIDEFAKVVNEAYSNRRLNKPNSLKKSLKKLEVLGGENFIGLIGDSLVRDKLYQLYFLATEQNDKVGLRRYYEKKINDLNN
ncbi:AAA family ATPase [Flavobacterium jumunjinense]|uniref:AAA family ATPase n=1 Tax=Flavobacterium jumunjinense TaxID=998845 RepID=A0ABV5GS21_9FLAO|nr:MULTISPECIES: ATP-binding protein [Flavobacterium]